MISLNYLFWSTVFFFFYIYIEVLNSILFYSLFKNMKNYFINYSKKKINHLVIKYIFQFYTLLIFVYILLLKVEFVNNCIISVIIVFVSVHLLLKNQILQINSFILFNVNSLLVIFIFIKNFIIFFLFIELYSIIFYFFFINKNNNINLLQYKNMILFYLFNNFFSTIMFLLGIYFIIFYHGTLNFLELSYLKKTPHIEIYLIISSFLIKLSLPGFHFLKIEIYKYLAFDSIIVYSVVTLVLNYVFILTFFNQNIIYINISKYRLFNLIIMLSILIIIQKLKLNNFYEFIAYSGFSTNVLIVINYII